MTTLTREKIISIESKTKDLLQEVFGFIDDLKPPIEISKILEKYNLNLVETTFTDSNISGGFERPTNTIYISKDESYPRQKFTLAHELGHFIMHSETQREVYYRHQIDDPGQDINHEAEANAFAAALLMPDTILRSNLSKTSDMDDLVKIFGVSYSAMYYRLKNLGLLSYIII
ncbi:ImmA/IrrE family metallo-endopeptidase [Candidatus Dojkabacteria bacterium]|nr:ImmA/IrrE family metallo-endopeptidase [Candidatus Dojkabacteria bacterium]